MATLRQSCHDHNDTDIMYAGRWQAQTFTPVEAYKITSVKIRVYRLGSPGTLTVSIRAVDGDAHPVAPDLCVGTINANAFTIDANGVIYEISLGNGVDLEPTTQYGVVCRALTGDSSNGVYWRKYTTSDKCPGGRMTMSLNSGASWFVVNYDHWYETWGEVMPPTIGQPFAFVGSYQHHVTWKA